VPYFHVVFTLPARIAAIAYQNKAAVYDLLFKAVAETVLTIAADPKHLGACTGITAVLHTWGSTMTHHPHVHMIVPGGGISLDGSRWVSCRPRFLLPVPVLSKLFRELMLQKLLAAHKAGQLQFFGQHTHLAERKAFAAIWRRCASASGTSTQSPRLADPRPCSLICRATPTASPSPIVG
jgi:Putative transposase